MRYALWGLILIIGGSTAGSIALTRATTPMITEADPLWVPRVPGSHYKPVRAGDCGQWNGQSWHRIDCPRGRS